MQFIADLEPNDDGSLQIMYGIDGRRDLTETTRDDLSGYVGARPVRVGNGAFDQRQNDVYGAALDSILLHTQRSQRLPRRLWPIVVAQAEGAIRVWREPDQGIWEARGEPQHYVSSKLMCWVAMDRAAKLAEIRGDSELAATWRGTAHEIKADILEHGVDARGVLRQHYATDALDASTLLAAIFGFLPGDDERLRASVLAIADELTEHGFVLRYKTDETDDGLSGKEGTFLICSFWLVSALAIIGELQRARELMERLLREASPLGLYAEEFDADTSRHLGNFPQAFSHLALIEAAARIIIAERMEEMGHERLRRHRDRERRRRRHAGPPAGLHRQAHPAARARRLAAARAGELGRARGVRGQPLRLGGHLVRRERQAVPAAGPLLRGRRDQALRRRALPPARRGLRRAPAPRRHLPRLADRLRRDGAVLHARRAALPGPRGARRGPDRAAGERAVPVPGRQPRAAHPAAVRRPRGGRAPSVPRALRRHARRGEHAVRPLRALRHLRRLPVPRAREVRRRGAGRPPGARASERHAAHQRRGDAAGDERRRARAVTGVVVERDGARETFTSATSSSSPAARRTAPSCCSRRRATPTPAGSPTARTRSGATTCSTTARPCWRCRRSRTRPCSRRRSGSTTSTSRATRVEFPLGNIQMVGKSVAQMYRGEKPIQTKLAPERTLDDRSRATRSTSGSRPRTCRGRRTA